MAKGKLNKGNRPKQDGYEIVLDPRASEVKQIWVRFGTLDAKRNPKWDRTMDMGPVAFNKRQKKAVAMVHDDQLPAPADSCLYQLLCEIDDKHGHPEILMTKPTKLMSAGKLLRGSS